MPTPDTHTLLPWVARAWAITTRAGDRNAGEQFLRAAGAPERALRIFSKAAVPASGTLDSDLDTAVMVGAYSETLRASSAAVRLLLDGAVRRAPFNQRLALLTTGPSAGVVSEGLARPVSRAILNGEMVTPVTVSSLMVLTSEMLRDTSPAMESLFNKELRSTLGAAIDSAFFGMLIGDGTDAPIIGSSGGTASDCLNDLRAALMATNALGQPQLYFVMGERVAKMLTTLSANGVLTFSDMSPSGGTILGTPAIVSSGLADDELILIEGSCVAGNIGAIELLSSTSADIEMADPASHDSITPAPSQLVSMFSTNSVSLRASAVLGAVALRPNAAVRIENVNYGG